MSCLKFIYAKTQSTLFELSLQQNITPGMLTKKQN